MNPSTVRSNEIDLAAGWDVLWGAIPNLAAISNVLAIVGVIVLIAALLPWLWQKRKGGMSGMMSGFPWVAVIIAAALAGPSLIIPILLNALSVVINILVAAAAFVIDLF